MKKILIAGILLTSMVNADVSDLDKWEVIGHEQSSSQNTKMVAQQGMRIAEKMNSYAKCWIGCIGRTAEIIGNGLDSFGTKLGAFGSAYVLLEKTIVSNLISSVSYAAQLGLEYAAWNVSSKAVSLPLKDLADTIEAKGTKTSYLSKLAWITTGVGFGVKLLGNSLSWLGKKAYK